MELNLENKCRACLTENETMLSLFEVYEHELTLAMILQSCISKEVNENDGLPTHLCDSCILVLTQFYNFTVVYEESDRQLLALLRKYNIKEETESVEDNEDEAQQSIFKCEANEDMEQQQLLSDEITEMIIIEQEETEDTHLEKGMALFELKNNDSNDEDGEVNDVADVNGIDDFKKEVFITMTEEVDTDNNEYVEVIETGKFKRGASDCRYEDIIKYECTICGEAHMYSSSFLLHMRSKHQLHEINCEDFAKKIRIKVNSNIDTVAYDLDKDSTTDPKTNNTICSEEYNTETLKCDICDKQFLLPHQLQHHVKLHDVNKKFVCEFCGARFVRKTYLEDHIERHSTVKRHICNFCGKAFHRRTVLRAHKRVHTHPNYYVCEICGNAFTNKSTLKTHRLLIHIKERNFKCMICNLTFPLKSTLNKHVLRHEKREKGEKEFHCTQCEMQYRDKSSLKRHVDTKHQGRVQMVCCPDCPKKYISKANLMKHRRRHHAVPIDRVN